MTTRAVSTEMFSSPRLAGFWQFRAGGVHYLGIFETDEDNGDGRLSAAVVADRRLQRLRQFAATPEDVRAAQACVDGNDLVFALEVNQFVPARVARLPLGAVAGDGEPAELEGLRDVALSESQLAAVNLPLSEHWNVAGPLAPQRWLFSVQPLCASPRGDAIANTADGGAAVLTAVAPRRAPTAPAAPAPAAGSAGVLIPNAALPQAWSAEGRLTMAFIRPGEPYLPFWWLRRYSSNQRTVTGALTVTETPGETVDLSRSLDIGPVDAVVAVSTAQGAEWLFASRRGPGGAEVFGVVRRGGNWQLAGRWEIDIPADRISVLDDGGGWHLVAGTESPDGWTLHHARLDPS